jgi:hypothetical protein
MITVSAGSAATALYVSGGEEARTGEPPWTAAAKLPPFPALPGNLWASIHGKV